MTNKFIESVITVSHVDFSSYDLKNHSLIYSSGLAKKILGYSDAELKEFAQDYNRKIIHPDDLEVVDRKLEEILNSKPGQIIETIVRYKRRDGRYIWGYTRKIVADWDEDGKPLKITTVAQDISEMVAIQEELEHRVALLDEINYRNAHELRGPVASILGLVNLMKDQGMVDEFYNEILSHLCRTVEKLDMVVNDLVQVDGESELEEKG